MIQYGPRILVVLLAIGAGTHSGEDAREDRVAALEVERDGLRVQVASLRLRIAALEAELAQRRAAGPVPIEPEAPQRGDRWLRAVAWRDLLFLESGNRLLSQAISEIEFGERDATVHASSTTVVERGRGEQQIRWGAWRLLYSWHDGLWEYQSSEFESAATAPAPAMLVIELCENPAADETVDLFFGGRHIGSLGDPQQVDPLPALEQAVRAGMHPWTELKIPVNQIPRTLRLRGARTHALAGRVVMLLASLGLEGIDYETGPAPR